MDKINSEQIEKLIHVLDKHKLTSKTILNLLKINSLSEIDILQYNILLLIIELPGELKHDR